MKDGFIIHISDADLFEDLSDGEVGMILRAMIAHAKGEEVEEFTDRTMKTVLRKLIVHMDFDAAKWEESKQKRIAAGKKGAEAKKKNAEQSEAMPSNAKQCQAMPSNAEQSLDMEAVNVNVNVNGNGNVNGNVSLNPYMSGKPDEGDKKKSANAEKKSANAKSDYADERAEVIGYLNLRSGKSFKADSASAVRFINGRLKDGYTVADMKHVIRIKCNEWKDTERDQYLRPETLFSSTKFEGYLNQRPVKPKTSVYNLSDSMKHDYDLKELARRAKAE